MRKMSRRKVAVAGVVAMVVLIIGLLTVPSLAANENSATVIIDPVGSTCTVIDPKEPPDPNDPNAHLNTVPADKFKLISTNNENGNMVFQCEVWGYADLYDIELDSAIVLGPYDFLFDNGNPKYKCTASGTSTFDWQETISAAGDLKLTCHFN